MGGHGACTSSLGGLLVEGMVSLSPASERASTNRLRCGQYRHIALGVPPEDRIQLPGVVRVGTGKVHLCRLLRAGSLLAVQLVEKPIAQVPVIGLIGRLRSRSGEGRRHQWSMGIK